MKKLLFFSLFVVTIIVRGQEVDPYKFTSIVDLYEFPTVGATGNLDAQIPLHTINTRGLELPLTLNYDQMGNSNVFYIGNQFGDAWVLNAIGTISREISKERSVLDTSVTGSIMCGGNIVGSYSGRRLMVGPYVPDEFYYSNNSNVKYRLDPDHYTFSFMGLSGKFTIYNDNGDLKAQLLESTDFAKIDVVQPSSWELVNTINIYDKNGYRYKFSSPTNINQNDYFESIYLKGSRFLEGGCSFSSLQSHSLAPSPGAEPRYFPDGALISRQIFTDGKPFWRNLELTEIYDKDNMLLVSYEYDTVGMGSGDSGNNWVSGLGLNRTSQKLFLKKINIINQGSIIFNNTVVSNGANVINSFTNNIEVKDLKNNLVKKFTLDFQKKEIHNIPFIKDYKNGSYGLSFQKRLLTRIREYNTTSDNFLSTLITYKDAPLINNSNVVVDRYGFLTKIGYCHMHLSKNDYRANSFILQKIKYPTGGSVVYEFEPHTFSNNLGISHYKDRNYDNHIYETLPLTQLSDRITFIANEGDKIYIFNKGYLSAALYKTVSGTLQYVSGSFGNLAQENGACKHEVSSIVVPTSQNNIYTIKNSSNYTAASDFAVYRFKHNDASYNFRYAEGNRIAKIAYFKDNVSNNILSTPAGVATAEKLVSFDYSEQSSNNASSGRVRYTYDSDSEMKPLYIVYDKVVTNMEGVGTQYTKYDFPYFGTWQESTRTDVNYSKVYDLSNQLVSESNYTYTYATLPYHSTAFTNHPKPFILSSSVINKNYEHNNCITSTISKVFDNTKRQIISQTVEDNLGKILKTEFNYDTKGNKIVNTHVRNYVNNSLTNELSNSYDVGGNLIKTEFKTPDMSAYEQIGMVNPIYRNGLLSGYTQLDGTSVTLVYGYGNTQLIAKIINLNAADYYSSTYIILRNNIAAQSNQSNTNYNETNLKSTLNSLRTIFDNSLVTSYTYKPMVGISSITDENGKTTTYEYDTFNRLKTTKDHSDNILKEYQYNFIN